MSQGTVMLPAAARAILEEEEALLARVRDALGRAAGGRPTDGRRAVEELRHLRDQASTAHADDLPSLLHEMSVRQTLRQRPVREPLPDARAPYLAHLRVREGQSSKDYLLGHLGFIDTAAGVRIVDWRIAPVAQIFYRYREGDPYEEEFPGRVAEGVVEARRVLVISGGVLRQIVGDDIALSRAPDGRWQCADRGAHALQPGGAGTAARAGLLGVGVGATARGGPADVTALLDEEQYAAITAPPSRPLLVLGSAGSGKTTVALHRLAHIAAREPERYPLSQMKVVVPSEGLARLIARILQPLGVGAAAVRTLDSWSVELARAVFGAPFPRLSTEAPAAVSRLKRHPALYDALRACLAGLRVDGVPIQRLRRRLSHLLSDRSFLGGVVAAAGGDLPQAAIEETVRHTVLQIAEPLEKQLRDIVDEERKQAIDGRPLWEGTPDELAGTLDLEDLPILLFLRAWRGDLDAQPVSHLVLDESEDFSLFELFVLGKLLGEQRGPADRRPDSRRDGSPSGRIEARDASPSGRREGSATLAGDEAQQTLASFAGWERSVATLGVGDAATCRLAISYRCPRPVAELAHAVLGPLAPPAGAQPARDGAPVGRFHFPDEAQAHLFLAGAVRDLCEREPQASVAVVAHGPAAARRFHELLGDLPAARLVLAGDFSFAPGVDVTDVDNVKGLEFDYVVVPDATAAAYPLTDEARRRLHVAVTRASHQLWLVSSGAPSPILGPP